jgi:hypothetical protein
MANRLEKLAVAPDFEIKDLNGSLVHLSELYRRQPVVLVMNRGFT